MASRSTSLEAGSEVRVRFAPSPTGYLHVGGARTALYNWLFARKSGGKFIFRVEDTDQGRSTEESLNLQVSDIEWLGLLWDEGPKVGGPYGPYRQSERRPIYSEHAERLLSSNQAYYCFCSDEILEQKKQLSMKEGRPPHYDGTCRLIPLETARQRIVGGEKAAVRFHIRSQKDLVLRDLIRGDVNFPSGMVGDFIVLRSDGFPVYNFCCVVDDALMKITHVLRAEEHLSNTVRQLLLYEAFGYTPPVFGHLSIILGSDRQKLSKRHGATSCFEFANQGYLPEALNNFLSLLGWSPPSGNEVMSTTEMINQFSLDRFTPSPAMFDDVKLKWMNATHLRSLSHSELWRRVKPFLDQAGLEFADDEEWQSRALGVLKTSMETLKDAVPLFELLCDSKYQLFPEGLETMSWEGARKTVETWAQQILLFPNDFLNEADFLSVQEQVKNLAGTKGKFLFMPIRVAVIGKPHGAELKQLVPLLRKSSLVERAQNCLAKSGR